ncbi:MAG: hypothetical protein AAF078_01580, partial [Planctomycetota bacterium]
MPDVTPDLPAPAATKNKRSPMTTWLLAALAFGVSAVIALTVVLLTMDRGTREVGEGEAIEATLGYDPAANPFTIRPPNALGIGVTATGAVVVDASASARPWLGDVAAQLQSAGVSATLITEDGPTPLDPRTAPEARGLGDAGEALAATLRADPTEVV